ncbi:multinuclear nonheme iron-dependent oxidase [Fluviicola sp.]|uniref:multinuclear nonheme iron-dependent oxidase n=1 Tax=Fluviicola sp. TaxID=1917219 RepID=UPI003D2CDDC1
MVDTHDNPVPGEVWKLYQLAHNLTGGVSTLLEWDANIPAFPELIQELHLAKEVIQGNIPNTPLFQSKHETVSNPVSHQLTQPYE